jgi:hypothetical protein
MRKCRLSKNAASPFCLILGWRLIDIYTKQVAKIIQRGGGVEDALCLPTCALEKLALRMVIEAAQSTLKEKVREGFNERI